jgi:ABC-type spermidine/putrescine transport system permease subunit I
VDGIMYGNIIQSQFVQALNWPMGALMSLVMLAAMLVLLLVFGRFVRLMPLGEE